MKGRNTQILQANELKKMVGKNFTFFKFLDIIVKCSKVAFQNKPRHSSSEHPLEAEILVESLERMEMSIGFNSLEMKTNRPHTSKATLLPSKNAIKNLNTAKSLVKGMKGMTQQQPTMLN